MVKAVPSVSVPPVIAPEALMVVAPAIAPALVIPPELALRLVTVVAPKLPVPVVAMLPLEAVTVNCPEAPNVTSPVAVKAATRNGACAIKSTPV
jgi:hypothetical protein